MAMLNKHIANINRLLKDIKSDVMADFIQADQRDLVITTNKVAVILDLNTIESYIKNVDIVNSKRVISPRLPKYKLYLKILDISYFIKDTNLPITSETVKKILQTIHIFNDIILASCLSKYNIVVI